MVRGNLRIEFTRKKRKYKSQPPIAVHTLSAQNQKEAHQAKLDQCVIDHPNIERDSTEKNRMILKKCVMEAATESVGRARRKQPDWPLDSVDTLLPLLSAKQCAHCKFLQTNQTADKNVFGRHQGAVKQAIHDAKEEWQGKQSVRRRRADNDGQALDNCRWCMQGEDQLA